MLTLEIVRPHKSTRPLKAAVFDYDGTISLIVEGWQNLLLEIFQKHLQECPDGDKISEGRLREIIDLNTGKQTIAQTYSLVEEMKKLGGKPLSPQKYLDEYLQQLDGLTTPRVQDLKSGKNRERYLVPGIREFLAMLRQHGLTMFVVSGSPESTVQEGIELFGLSQYFDGGVFGTLPNREDFSKAAIIDEFLKKRGLCGEELVGFGDGHVETSDVHRIGGLAVGIAFNETERKGIDAQRRLRLIAAGANWIISNYANLERIEAELFPKQTSKAKIMVA